jgi:Uma2 family endonuclease
MTLADPAAAPARPRLTADDVIALTAAGRLAPEDRVEVIDGDMVRMQAKNFPHERWKQAVAAMLIRGAADDLVVFVEPSVVLGEDLFEPDVLVVGRSALARQGEGLMRLEGADIALLIEIADTSAAFDLGAKARAYARHGVPELWVVEIAAERTVVHQAPAPRGAWTTRRRVPFADTLRPLAPGLPEVTLAGLA